MSASNALFRSAGMNCRRAIRCTWTVDYRKGLASPIFVWNPQDKAFGHASMSLDTGAYVSWWPRGEISGFGSKDAQSQRIPGDKKAEGRNPDYASPPIKGLDQSAMTMQWKTMSGRLFREDYSIAHNSSRWRVQCDFRSCAGVVLDILKEGKMYEKYPLTTMAMWSGCPFC